MSPWYVFYYCLQFSFFSNLVRDNVINVHLVAHSHDDTGYRKTTDDYYYGTRNCDWLCVFFGSEEEGHNQPFLRV